MRIETNVPLQELTSLKIGGKANFFLEARDETAIRKAVLFSQAKGLPLFVLGGGTNVVLPDEGWPGLVIKICHQQIKKEGERLLVEAGTAMEELLEAMLTFGLSGLEWAGGLPGTVGGAVRGNAGAFGGEIKDALLSATVMDRGGKIKTLGNKECRFRYRRSIFKDKPWIVLSAVLKLSSGRDPKKSRALIEEKSAFRKKKHPLEFPNVGSIFQNLYRKEEVKKVIKLFPSIQKKVQTDWQGRVPAAFLIERAGIKGLSLGGAKVSERHSNFIINYQNATAADFRELMKIVQRAVRELFSIVLKPEIEVVPRTHLAPDDN